MSAGQRHILLVEDEPGTMTTVTLLLEMAGYRVTQAANGRKGLERLAQELPDIVVTDYMMPHVDGLSMIRQMRQIEAYSGVPVILTSGALPVEIDAKEVAQGFLAKPYHIERLLELVESLIGKLPGDSAN
jgi:CheY-like chemotaxis protein